MSQEKVKTMLMQFFWENKVYYGRCANGESQFERKWFFLCWLYKGFQGQHLPCLSINFVVINKDLEKLQTQLYYIKVWFCDDQVYNDIRVVLSTKWRHNLFYLQLYFMALGTVLPKSLTEAFFSFLSNTRFDFLKLRRDLWERYRDILEWSFYG